MCVVCARTAVCTCVCSRVRVCELCNRVICLSEKPTHARTAVCVVRARTAVCIVRERTAVCVVCVRALRCVHVCVRACVCVCVNCATELFA